MKSPLCLLLLSLSPAPAGGLFDARTIDEKITIGYGLAIGDVDGDSKPDILLADAREIVWYRNPGWEKSVIAKNLTLRDNVCLAARDLDGDGKVEIAAGAQWNPGETSNGADSGAVFYLQRPGQPGAPWTPVALPHEPTVHRMHWVRTGPKSHALVVAPLHGRGNINGAGPKGARIIAYTFPENPAEAAAWKQTVIDESLHVTHNFDLRPMDNHDEILIGARETLLRAVPSGEGWETRPLTVADTGAIPPWGGAGEVRFGPSGGPVCCIEPFHGPSLTLLTPDAPTRSWKRRVLDSSFNQGHALATGSVLRLPGTQIVAGWREPNAAKQFGIKIYHEENGQWLSDWVCEPNTMACEDVKIADLDGDDRPEIIAAGRSTKNVVIYKTR